MFGLWHSTALAVGPIDTKIKHVLLAVAKTQSLSDAHGVLHGILVPNSSE